MVQTEITIKSHGLCLQRNILVENALGIMIEPTVPFVQKLLVRKVSRFKYQLGISLKTILKIDKLQKVLRYK